MGVVSPADAGQFIAGLTGRERLFLVHGGDAGGVTEQARALEAAALARGGGDAVIRLDSGEVSADPARLLDEAYGASLFGGEPVVAIRILDGRHNVLDPLKRLLADPPPAFVVVEAGELRKDSALLKAFAASGAAAALETPLLQGGGLADYIAAAADAEALALDAAALALLRDTLAGDRLAARSEIGKLALYVGEAGTATAADVRAVVADIAESDNDDLIQAMFAGDSEALEEGLERLRLAAGSGAALLSTTLYKLGASGAAPEARRKIADAVLVTRRHAALDMAAASEALHALARRARR